MARSVRCHCHGNPACKLCRGEKFYPYEPGPRGWMPFRCPTCEGTRAVSNGESGEQPCFSCNGTGVVDPANPPYDPGWKGALRIGWKIFFGGG